MTTKTLKVLDIQEEGLSYGDGETAVIAVEYREDDQVKALEVQVELEHTTDGNEWTKATFAQPAQTEDGQALKDTLLFETDTKQSDEEKHYRVKAGEVTSEPFAIKITPTKHAVEDQLTVSDISKAVSESGVTLSVNVLSRYADVQFAWYKDDVKVEGSENKSTLSLGNDVSKAGTYAVKAKAENKRGQFRRKAEKRITVGEVDLKPTEHQEVPPKGPGTSPTDQHPDGPNRDQEGKGPENPVVQATKLTLSQTNLGELTEGDVLNINAVPDKGNPADLQNVQWYQLVGGQETPITGQVSLNLNLVVGAEIGTDIYVKATSNGVAVESDKAHIAKLRHKDITVTASVDTAKATKLAVGQRFHVAAIVNPIDSHVTYKWEREVNSIRVPLQSTEATLTIDPVSLTDSGDYYLTATRFDKTVTTLVAKLDVDNVNTELPITISLDQTGSINKPLRGTFTLVATVENATEAATYNWYRTPTGGQPAVIPGQVSKTLVISDLKVSDAGSYYLEVTDGVRAPVKSSPVYLNVVPEPTAEPNDPSGKPADPLLPGNSQHTFTNLKIASFRNYANMMQPTKVIKPLEGLQWQIRLYHDLLDILKYPGVTVYMDAMDAAVDFFHHYSDTLFSMTNRARYLQLATDAELSKDEREALLEIFNVFASMADPAKNQRWELNEVYDILRDSTAYSRLVQYYDRKFMANLSADETGRQFE